jgi:hypothetical protein
VVAQYLVGWLIATVVTRVYSVDVTEAGWVVLAYRLPREPSGPRVTVWRKFRRLGALQVVDGLVALPATAATIEAFGWLADEVIEAGGEAWTWQGTGSKQQDRALRQQLREAIVDEYAALIEDIHAAGHEPPRRTVERLRRALREIERRDYVTPKERDDARRALQRLTKLADTTAREPAR